MNAIVFDFDGTLTKKQAVRNKEAVDIIGGYERMLQIAAFVRDLHKKADLFICSANNANIIRETIDEMYNIGVHIKSKWFKKIVGHMLDNKYSFVNSLEGYQKIIFVDDSPESFESVDLSKVTTYLSSRGGITLDDMFAIRTNLEYQAVYNTPPRHTNCGICKMIKK